MISAVRTISASDAVWAAVAFSAASWSAVAVARESRFLDGRYNLGNFTQALWSTAHRHFMQMTEVGGHEVSRLGLHVDPIIAFLTPLWWVWPDPRLLLAVEASALALGAIPLFWLSRKHLRHERDAALVAIAYLFAPTIARISGQDERQEPALVAGQVFVASLAVAIVAGPFGLVGHEPIR